MPTTRQWRAELFGRTMAPHSYVCPCSQVYDAWTSWIELGLMSICSRGKHYKIKQNGLFCVAAVLRQKWIWFNAVVYPGFCFEGLEICVHQKKVDNTEIQCFTTKTCFLRQLWGLDLTLSENTGFCIKKKFATFRGSLDPRGPATPVVQWISFIFRKSWVFSHQIYWQSYWNHCSDALWAY